MRLFTTAREFFFNLLFRSINIAKFETWSLASKLKAKDKVKQEWIGEICKQKKLKLDECWKRIWFVKLRRLWGKQKEIQKPSTRTTTILESFVEANLCKFLCVGWWIACECCSYVLKLENALVEINRQLLSSFSPVWWCSENQISVKSLMNAVSISQRTFLMNAKEKRNAKLHKSSRNTRNALLCEKLSRGWKETRGDKELLMSNEGNKDLSVT